MTIARGWGEAGRLIPDPLMLVRGSQRTVLTEPTMPSTRNAEGNKGRA